MAEDIEKDEQAKLDQDSELSKIEALVEGRVPDTFKLGRDAALQLSKVERDLFTDMEERESGKYVISGLEKFVTDTDFSAFTFAVSQILYNQSYISGNADVNSGIERKKARRATAAAGTEVYRGEIIVSLNELCRLGYGMKEPTTEAKKKMAALIDSVHKQPVKIKFPNGDELEAPLCVKMGTLTRAKDGAKLYGLRLNAIFGYRLPNNFGELPQNIMQQLSDVVKKKTTAHYQLLRWLSVQDKREAHTLTIDRIIYELRMEDDFKINRGRAEKQLLSICKAMVDIKLLDGYDVTYSTGRRKGIERITFHLNPAFIRLPKAEADDSNNTKKKRGKREA